MLYIDGIGLISAYNISYDNLLAVWDFNYDSYEINITHDVSGNGYNGYMVRSGIISNGMFCDDGTDNNNDAIEINAPDLWSIQNFTIYAKAFENQSGLGTIFANGNGEGFTFGSMSADRLYLKAYGLTATEIKAYSYWDDNGVWHDLFGWYNGSYLCAGNTTQTQCSASTGTITQETTDNVTIGVIATGAPISGCIDRIVLYNSSIISSDTDKLDLGSMGYADGKTIINFSFTSIVNVINVSYVSTYTNEYASLCFRVLNESGSPWRCDNSTEISLTEEMDEVYLEFMSNSSVENYTAILITSDVTGGTESSPSLPDSSNHVLNLTFNNESDPYKDYTDYNHNFTAKGNAQWVNKTYGKYYGALNLSGSEGDFLNASSKFKLDNGYTATYWLYYRTDPNDLAQSSCHWQVGYEDDNDAIGVFENVNAYGIVTLIYNSSGDVNEEKDSVDEQLDGQWYFIAITANSTHVVQRVNNVIKEFDVYDGGDFADTFGKDIQVGEGRYCSAMDGYIDEFNLYNSTLNETVLTELYEEYVTGTPPDLDLYIENIKYDLPYNWSDINNSIIRGGSMYINFTIKNGGTTNSNLFNYDLSLTDDKVCNGTLQLDAGQSYQVNCSWTTKYGFQSGYVTIDTNDNNSEDIETNNIQRVYIPFLDRPWFHFNRTDFYENYKPYCEDAGHEDVLDPVCGRIDGYTSLGDFNNGWTCNSVDPYGSTPRTHGYTCMYHDYDPTNAACIKTWNHLYGWSNRTTSECTNVQALHQFLSVGIAFDLMFPNMTQEQYLEIGKGLYDKCQQITNLDNTRPDLDNDDLINGGNGFGFGSGMGGFCYSLLGVNNENPTLIQNLSQQEYGSNIADEWMDREVSLLRAYKNDSFSFYQEGFAYYTYALPHIAENLYFESRFGLNNISQYDNALCSMSKELAYTLLDTNYNGNSLRNDKDFEMRYLQRGDSESYKVIDDSLYPKWSYVEMLALACGDTEAKEVVLSLRNIAYQTGDDLYSYPSFYTYKILLDEVGGSYRSPEAILPKFVYDNANDILMLRTNFTYENDTIIQIDGGEERGGGHSQAQGYYLYALGEPFLDYEQVPYEDDVRAEYWKNGISLQNTTQTIEGVGGSIGQYLGDHPVNQYNGMRDSTAYFSTDYPNYRRFPLEYGGDLEDYVGTADASFAGVYVWRPYSNAEPVEEYFVKYGNMLAKRTTVKGNTQGEGVYHNFINIYDEFNNSMSDDTLNLSRLRVANSTNLRIKLQWANETMTFGGGETNITYCFSKTSCSSSSRGLGKYGRYYLYSASNDIDFIISHDWYYTGEEIPYSSVVGTGSSDRGIQSGNGEKVLFDTDDDGKVIDSAMETDGWALAYKGSTEAGCFNCTYLDVGSINLTKTNDSISLFVNRSATSLVLTTNTMQRDSYIDAPQSVEVTLITSDLTNNSNYTVLKNGAESVSIVSQGTDTVTFNVITDQNSDYYVITASEAEADIVAPIISAVSNRSTTNISTEIIWETNEASNSSVSYGTDESLGTTVTNVSTGTAHLVSLSGLVNNTLYYYNVTSCDASGNCNTSGTYNFTTDYFLGADGEGSPVSGGGGGSSYSADEQEGSIMPGFTLKGNPVLNEEESFWSKWIPDFSGIKGFMIIFGFTLLTIGIFWFGGKYIIGILKGIFNLIWIGSKGFFTAVWALLVMIWGFALPIFAGIFGVIASFMAPLVFNMIFWIFIIIAAIAITIKWVWF